MAQLVDLKVGFTCNNRCIHCVVSDKKDECDLPFESIKQLVEDYIARYSKISLTLTGGEITYRDDYDRVMRFVRAKKEAGSIAFVDMQTNGRLLANDEILNETIGVVDFFLIALHGSTAEIHDQVTTCPGSYCETVLGLSKLVSHMQKDSVAIQTVLNKKNYRDLRNIYRFAYETYGIVEYNITFPHPLGTAYDTEVTPTYAEVKNSVNDALGYCLENNMSPYLEALPYCVFDSRFHPYVSAAYERINHNVVGYGGERDGHLDYQEALADSHVKYDSCRSCSFTSSCEGVWREYRQLYPLDDMYRLFST